jgi:Flp pilus assembly protein TadD/ketosteroid isomerase-like protein
MLRLCLLALIAATALAARADELAEATELLRAGKHGEAMARVDKLLAAKPDNAKVRFLKGVIHTDQGDTRAAIDIFRKLTEDHPELPEPYNNLAVIYASQGEYDRARMALEKSIRTHPSYATAYENLGDVYARLASQAYDKALELDSSNAAAQSKLALVRDLVGTSPPTPKIPIAMAEKPAPVAEKPVAQPEKPAPANAKPAVPQSGVSGAVLESVRAWADAWGRKDAETYLSAYAPEFRVPGGKSRADWENLRRARVTAPKSISVTVDSPKVSVQSGDRASVTFLQRYESDRFSGTTTKTLVLSRSADGRWRIVDERVSN